MLRQFIFVAALLYCCGNAVADDWPSSGRDNSRNSVSPELNPPTTWEVSDRPSENVKWISRFSSPTYGSPVVTKGKVWIITSTALEKHSQRGSVLKCLAEEDGRVLYEKFLAPMPGDAALTQTLSDQFAPTVVSTPFAEDDLLWYFTNQYEVVCLDVEDVGPSQGEPKTLWRMDLKPYIAPEQASILIHMPTLGPS